MTLAFFLQGPTLLRHAAFVPPGYTSLLFHALYKDSACAAPTALFRGFRRFVLAPFGLWWPPEQEGSAAADDADFEDVSAYTRSLQRLCRRQRR